MPSPETPGQLRRVLTFWPLVFYGLSVIVGAGIYVAIGAVIARAGPAAPLSFLLAGLAACLTGLCYAELAGRIPEASGAVAFVRAAFARPWLARLTGLVLALTVAISSASIAAGAARYLAALLPLPTPLLIALLVAGFTAIAAAGVRLSVGLAALTGAVEIALLLAAATAGLLAAPSWDPAPLLPATAAAWHGVLAGAFIAFFAFIGFETIANLAEETRAPARTVPRGILGAILAAIALYALVATAVVLTGGSGDTPLLGLFSGRAATIFAVLAALAVANGVLVELIMLARLLFGMARAGEAPAVLARLHPRTAAPARAAIAGGARVLVTALALPFARLLATATLLTLLIFMLADLALWRLHRAGPAPAGAFTLPRFVPPLAAAACAAMILFELAG